MGRVILSVMNTPAATVSSTITASVSSTRDWASAATSFIFSSARLSEASVRSVRLSSAAEIGLSAPATALSSSLGFSVLARMVTRVSMSRR